MVGTPAAIAQGLHLTYPPRQHRTDAARIFFIGTSPAPVQLNGQPIRQSAAGHFAPSRPLQPGINRFVLRSGSQEVAVTVERTVERLPQTLSDLRRPFPEQAVAVQPGELVCFGVRAMPGAQVQVEIPGIGILPLMAVGDRPELPSNAAVLVGQNQPQPSRTGEYGACRGFAQPQRLTGLVYRTVRGAATAQVVAPGSLEILDPETIEVATVTVPEAIARTGPSTDASRLTPLPQGTQGRVTGRQGDWWRWEYGGWVEAKNVRIGRSPRPPRSVVRGVTTQTAGLWTEVRIPLTVPLPVTVQERPGAVELTVHHATAETDTMKIAPSPILRLVQWEQRTPDRLTYRLEWKGDRLWGYKVRYEGTTLVFSLRHPPQGPITILLDPGHGGPEDLGARGPTGYPEKDVALTLAQQVRDILQREGAIVVMTRTGDDDLWPQQRALRIAEVEPTVALSLHYNALPDAGDAENTQGIGMFWYHRQSHGLAQVLHDRLTRELNRPSYGVFWGNLALARPTVAPSVLLELGFMIHPEEFEWIVSPVAQHQLARAIARITLDWIRQTPDRQQRRSKI
ncbi:MAG: N-acetylmuramoyl-L-alanine amidase [Oscillatoriales cyanobacterium SM2_1_8]|nr:N-acetylmuramoyl-L-alanine amidase [Oscillatoriales cyanobacterium SM2_1_8]